MLFPLNFSRDRNIAPGGKTKNHQIYIFCVNWNGYTPSSQLVPYLSLFKPFCSIYGLERKILRSLLRVSNGYCNTRSSIPIYSLFDILKKKFLKMNKIVHIVLLGSGMHGIPIRGMLHWTAELHICYVYIYIYICMPKSLLLLK